ncbi:MAG TPA: hypothetical protein VM242_10925, partial [Acidimicrobiales bacterium]|nr:hypothetical protein [Acidimicrobiales bacterium]
GGGGVITASTTAGGAAGAGSAAGTGDGSGPSATTGWGAGTTAGSVRAAVGGGAPSVGRVQAARTLTTNSTATAAPGFFLAPHP